MCSSLFGYVQEELPIPMSSLICLAVSLLLARIPRSNSRPDG